MVEITVVLLTTNKIHFYLPAGQSARKALFGPGVEGGDDAPDASGVGQVPDVLLLPLPLGPVVGGGGRFGHVAGPLSAGAGVVEPAYVHEGGVQLGVEAVAGLEHLVLHAEPLAHLLQRDESIWLIQKQEQLLPF